MIIAPSLLSADFLNLSQEIKKLEHAGLTRLHYDVMDGQFVPNISFGPSILKQIRSMTSLFLDVHLMIDQPENMIDAFYDAGADSITIHIENTPHIHRLIEKIKKLGIQAGVAINPGTSVCLLESIIHHVDSVLVMSVNPGFGGQSFITESIQKMKKIKSMIIEKGLSTQLAVDGGINRTTAPFAQEAGCDILVIGNAFFSANYQQEHSFYTSLK